MRRGILTGGTWCVDRNLLVDHWPEENGFATGVSVEDANGGSASNFAINMRKLDPTMPVATMTAVGDDKEGRFLMELADTHQIDRSRATVLDNAETALTYCFASQASGKRTHVAYFNANDLMTPDHFDFAGLDHRLFHLGLLGVHATMDAPWDGHANGWVATLIKARAAGLTCNLELCSVDRDLIGKLARPCLPHLDLFVVNDFEIGSVAGLETLQNGQTDVEACIEGARMALADGVAEIVAVHFPEGAIAVTADGTVARQPSVRIPPADVVGANGAGDAFAAGFVYGWHEGWDVARSLALGHAVAAASLREASTSGAVEPWATCMDIANRWGWRDPI